MSEEMHLHLSDGHVVPHRREKKIARYLNAQKCSNRRAVQIMCDVDQMPLFFRSSALAWRADRTRGESVASGSAVWMN